MLEEVIIAGFGGQGLMLMGRLLAYAGMLEGEKGRNCFPGCAFS
jgi:2-oxoglutarate ferredoxin oxidoreductase subunit gamma